MAAYLAAAVDLMVAWWHARQAGVTAGHFFWVVSFLVSETTGQQHG